MTVLPAKTLAVVVGIEEYDVGKPWRLNGPALDACSFARWLVARGVPGSNITLLVSPLPENAELVRQQSLGFNIGEAKQAIVRETFTRRLAQAESDLLIVYWGGHGVVDKEDDRRLIYSDATSHDKRSLNLTVLLKSLRSSSFPGHPRQVILVDACATLVEERGWLTTLPQEGFSVGREEKHRDQRALFAASSGELAINDDGRKSGLFSQVVLDALENMPAGTWPPDVETLRDKVNEHFHELREQGRTLQVPSYLWYRSQSGENHLVFVSNLKDVRATSAALGCQLLTFAEYRKLKQVLDGAPSPPALRELYREVVRSQTQLGQPRFSDDLMSSLDALRSLVNPMPLFEFLVRLAASSDAVTQHRLWEWIHTTASNYPVDIDALEALDNELHRTVFLVRLQPDLLDKGLQVTAWKYSGPDGYQAATDENPWSLNRLAEELRQLVEVFDPDHDILPIIEFQVPWEMLDMDLEKLKVCIVGTYREIGITFPVVIRSLDRLVEAAWREPWERKWRDLSARGGSYEELTICWADRESMGDLLDPTSLNDRVCMALTYEREAQLHQDSSLFAALRAGIPIVIWHRVNNIRRNHRGALEQVLRSRALRELPDVVLHQRKAARYPGALGDHAGRDLVLMWDDPNRVPPELEWQSPTSEGAGT